MFEVKLVQNPPSWLIELHSKPVRPSVEKLNRVERDERGHPVVVRQFMRPYNQV